MSDRLPQQQNHDAEEVLVEPAWRTTRQAREFFAQLDDEYLLYTLLFRAHPQITVDEAKDFLDEEGCVQTNEVGRIIELDLGESSGDLLPDAWELSVDHIVQLTHLSKLNLSRCHSVPLNALAKLPQLHKLDLISPNMINGIATMEEEDLYFNNLEELAIDLDRTTTFGDNSDAFAQFVQCLTSRFPKLRYLCIIMLGEEDLPILLEGLSRPPSGAPIKDQLRFLSLDACNIQETHLEKILFHILPQYTALEKVGLMENNIESLSGVAERLKRDNLNQLPPEVRASRLMLRQLNLDGNPIMATLATDDNKKSMMTLLEVFPLLHNLRFHSVDPPLPPKIENRLKSIVQVEV